MRLGQFTTANAPSGTEGALYFDTTENTTKLYSNSAWNDLGGGWDGVIPNYTTAQRDALSPSSGMMIYNTDYDQIQTYTKTAWSGITGSKDLGIECASSMDCASGFCVDSVCCDTSVENCNGDCEACNLAGHIGYCTIRVELDNTEVTSTCYYCNSTSDTSVTYTGESGVNCGTNFCYSGVCSSTGYCDEDDDGHYAESKVTCPSRRWSSTAGDDCNDTCGTCFPGSTAYTLAADGLDQDCDRVIDEKSAVICTPVLGGTATSYGFNSEPSCTWLAGGSYKYTLSAYSYNPTDTTRCIPTGITCTAYTGGWGGCAQVWVANNSCWGGSVVTTCAVPFGTSYPSANPANNVFTVVTYTCKAMTGCTTIWQYQ